jgi:alpha-glucosidase
MLFSCASANSVPSDDSATVPAAGSSSSEGPNRYRVSLSAAPGEKVYGCGEQFSYFNLRGRRFPLWTSEQGVGRNKKTPITFEADRNDSCGGDYWWTFFPQPTFASSEGRWYHLETSAYAEFDFRKPESHELYVWSLPEKLVIGASGTMTGLVGDISSYFGRQPMPPEWTHEGIILGIQGGTETCLAKARAAIAAGVKVSGIWAQDWEGINMTSFGQRLRWDWVWNPERYPGLDAEIARLQDVGIRFLGYVNCYVGALWSLFEEASRLGYLAKNTSGGDYLVDFGEFDAGIVDFTNPAAFEWYKSVIRRNMIDFGLGGWMADFGEYLPTDAVLHSGMDPELAHNLWPALWARCNYEAVAEAGKLDDILFFMRAGFTGSQRFCPSMWAGDQNVDWSEDDGLPSVITSALSLAMCGHGIHHSDIGGYTTLYGMKRTKELFMRWTEAAVFTTLMRSHEGNRPKDNWQFDSDAETLAHLAAMVRLHVALKDYLRALEAENAERGIPVIRPLFLHHGDEAETWNLKDQYLLGPDLLVAPVIREGETIRRAWIPAGRWVHLWSGEVVASTGTYFSVDAPIGKPPAWFCEASLWASLFRAASRAATLPE